MDDEGDAVGIRGDAAALVVSYTLAMVAVVLAAVAR